MPEILQPSPAQGGDNLPEFTVSALSAAVKRTIESGFERVRVRGEVSRPSVPASGHCYLRLKDEGAVLDAVIWKGTFQRLKLRPEEGMEVVCTGRLTTYPGKSTYQLIIDWLDLAGEGALLKLIEERRKRLAAEGLFDPARKRPLPFLPKVIGVITSPTGAVIRDILHRLADRFPRRVLICPVAVQGEGAASQIAQAIAGFNGLPPEGPVPRPDLLIVARGGGSIEDLMAFNDESVVRAAAASTIPLISAVGHETDTTLIDHAADWRAPTPTAAAERAVPVRAELVADLLREERRLVSGLSRFLTEAATRLDGLARALADPRRLIEERTQRLDERGERLGLAMRALLAARRALLSEYGARLPHPRLQLALARDRLGHLGARLGAARLQTGRTLADGRQRLAEHARQLDAAMARALADGRQRIQGLGQLLESFSYARVLDRGFVLVRDAAGEPVTEAVAVKPGDSLRLRFHDGERTAVAGEAAAPTERPPRRRRRRDSGQGELL